MLRAVLVLAVALAVAGPAAGATITKRATTASYKLTLTVGPKEAMYTAAEVKAKHPKDGEVMIGDSMDMGGMSTGSGNRHLEVHVASRASGKPVTNVQPSITLRDASAMAGMAMTEKVNAMAMYGIDEGAADTHYGDNVKLTAGHAYRVVVTIKGEKATFTFKA